MTFVPSFLRYGTCFDPLQLAALCEAYDRASATPQMANQPASVKETLAAEIIALAADGDCDPDRLCEVTLQRMAKWH